MVRMIILTKIKNNYEKDIDFGSHCAHECKLLRTEEPVGEKIQEYHDVGER